MPIRSPTTSTRASFSAPRPRTSTRSKDFAAAATAGRTLIARYPAAEPALRRTAWTVVAHSSAELGDYRAAEPAYAEVLELTPAEDAGRQALVDNLAASIYKQAEQANEAQDYRAAAGHFLRITERAPTSSIRPAAEYDAAAALMKVQDWTAAATVLDGFRTAFPDHELNADATKQLAFVYREKGEASLAAAEYERVAAEAADPELERDALLSAGELYEQSRDVDAALGVYERYLAKFAQPVDVAVETRFKVAEMYRSRADEPRYHEHLAALVAADAAAGAERSERTRYLAAQAGLVLAQPRYAAFNAVQLVQPFEKNLKLKRELMDAALKAFESLIPYEVGEVTTASTFYMAEIYSSFSRSLLDSERPTGLNAAELAEYEDVLEEQAFPFEERAIEVHEANVDTMIAAGIYNRWVEQSFARLAVLMPGRYAKEEQSIGLLGAIETFTYRSPGAPAPVDAVASAAEAEGRRARAPAQKGPTIKLEVLAGAGFTIADAARVSPELRERYLAAVGYARARFVRARRRRARSRDEAAAGASEPARRSRHRVRPHGPLRGRGREPRTSRRARRVSSDRARGARLGLPQARALCRCAHAIRARACALSRFPSREPKPRDPVRLVSARLRLRLAALRGVPSARGRRPASRHLDRRHQGPLEPVGARHADETRVGCIAARCLGWQGDGAGSARGDA